MASSKNLSGTDFMYSMQSMLYTSLTGCVFIGLLYCFEYFVNYLGYYCVSVGFDGFLPPFWKGDTVQSTGNPIISATNRGLSWEFFPY